MAAAIKVIPEDLFQNWNKTGRNNLLKLCKTKPKSIQTHITQNDIRKGLHQLIWITIHGEFEIQDALSLLQEALGDKIELISLFCDVLSVTDVETICLNDKSCREQFLSLLSSLNTVISEEVIKERLDPETLELAGFIASKKAFSQKIVRTKTKLFYKQQKYNLLREESEGYAKLISELSQDVSPTTDQDIVLEKIKSLLGFFNLDPNRVLDILLEAFECQVEEELFFIPLINKYLQHCDTAGFCHLVGFKFQFYHQSVDSVTPKSLYKLTAALLRNNLLLLEDLYPHLHPSDQEIHNLYKKNTSKAKEEARKMNAVILSEPTENDSKADKNDEEIVKDNQKFGLCEALLAMGSWKQGLKIIDRLPCALLMEVSSIARSLCHLIHCTMEPLYRSKFCPKAALGNIHRTQRGFPQPCLQYSQLNDNVFPMLLKIGVNLALDPILVVKIIRVTKGFMKEYNQATEILKEKQSAILVGIISLIDEVLFPVLSVLDCNCAIAEELWGLIKRLPYELRYRLYANWKNSTYNSCPRLILQKAKIIKRAKYITKRLSKENVKPSGRKIGKLSHSNPAVLFDHLLDQIQRYDNFIGPMVDALKYLNPLAYDVLAYCIIEALSNPAKERMKQSDTNLSDWLQSLSQFCGAVFKKYPTEITGLLQYIANQLKAGKSLDLLVLKEVVQKMSGVEANDEITTQQLEALSGGELIKSEGAYFSQIRNTRKPSLRLRNSLMEGKLTIPLCLLIAQQRNAIVYVEDQQRHLKLIGKLYDQCQDNLIQFGGFLTIQLSTHDYQASLPSPDEFHQVYGITPDVSFFLTRPVYKYEIQEKLKSLRLSITDKKDVTAKQKQTELEKSFCDICDTIFRPVAISALPLQSAKIWANLSPLLYVTFWSLTMYDLYTPKERYEEEIEKLKYAIDDVDNNKEVFTTSAKRKKEKERCQLLIEKLNDELQTQLEHNKLVKTWLESKKDAWFPSKTTRGEMITQFLQLCIFPRCVFSAIDAVYCAKFIQTVHALQASNFSTLICFDRTFSDVSYIVASLTENEASRYGRFLCAMLQMVSRWHGDKKLYEKECGKLPGFLTILRATKNEKELDYENFRHVCHKWQYKLTKALILGIESQDYTQIRNTLLVLIKILPYYPQVQNLGQALERRIEKVIEDEKNKRHDLQALAIGYKGMLRSRKEFMVPENKFHQENDKNPGKTKIGPPSSSSSKVNVKQESPEERPAKQVKKEKDTREDASSKSSSDKRSNSRMDTDSPRGEREKNIIEEEVPERRRDSPRANHSSENKDRVDRGLKENERLKEKRSRSPSNEDLKKRKRITEEAHNNSHKHARTNDKKADNKRMSTEVEVSESKRRKEDKEALSASPDQRSKKLEPTKREKVKKEYKEEEIKAAKKESKVAENKRPSKGETRTKHKKRDR